MTTTIHCIRPIPSRKGWARDKQCRILAGRYETVGPPSREIHVREQVGQIEGWSYYEWDDGKPLSVRLYIRVEI